MPIRFPIDAKHLRQDTEIFPAAMEESVALRVELAKEPQRQVQAWLSVPDGSAPGGSGIILK